MEDWKRNRAAEKKEIIQKRIDAGDKRGWNSIAADLELSIWYERFNPITNLKPETDEQAGRNDNLGTETQ